MEPKTNKYDGSTINSPNPIVRLSHRSRIKKGYDIVQSRLSEGRVLDYGCGTGVLINNIKCQLGPEGGNAMGMNLSRMSAAQKIPPFFQTTTK